MDKQWDDMTEVERAAHMCQRMVDIHGGNTEGLYNRLYELGARKANGAAFRFAFLAFLKSDKNAVAAWNNVIAFTHVRNSGYKHVISRIDDWYERYGYTDRRGAAYDIARRGEWLGDARGVTAPRTLGELVNAALDAVDWQRVAENYQEQ